eukprot:1353465-Alexandrium_andersonii.AAC.1
MAGRDPGARSAERRQRRASAPQVRRLARRASLGALVHDRWLSAGGLHELDEHVGGEQAGIRVDARISRLLMEEDA